MRKGATRWRAGTFPKTRLTYIWQRPNHITRQPVINKINSPTRDNGWRVAPPDGELAHPTAQNHVGISNRDRKTRNNQTDPNPNRQLLLGLNNPPHGGVPPIWPRPFLARSAAFLLQSTHNTQSVAEKGTSRKIQPTHTKANKENSTHAPPPPFNNIKTDDQNKEHTAVLNKD